MARSTSQTIVKVSGVQHEYPKAHSIPGVKHWFDLSSSCLRPTLLLAASVELAWKEMCRTDVDLLLYLSQLLVFLLVLFMIALRHMFKCFGTLWQSQA